MSSTSTGAVNQGCLGNDLSAGENIYGSRLLPQILDEYATSHPDRVYATTTLTPSISESYQEVKFCEVARATNFFVHWLKGHVDYGKNFETLAYMGLPDLRNPIVFLAAVKCDYKVCRKPFALFHGYGLIHHPWLASSAVSQKYCRHKSISIRTDSMHQTPLFFRVETFGITVRTAKERSQGFGGSVIE